MDPIVSKNPASGQLIRSFERTSPLEITRMLTAARRAQCSWADQSLSIRSARLRKVQERLIEQTDTWVELLSIETGKPKIESLGHEILPAIDCFNFAISGANRAYSPKNIPLRYFKNKRSTIHYEPHGVVAIIAPWNFPLTIPMAQIVMALLAGNAVILKPSEHTLSVGSKIGELFDLPEFPPGLFQIIYGDAHEGSLLVRGHPDKIFFTGSTLAGKSIMRAAAETLTPLCLELGGKDAFVVLADADIQLAAKAAAWGMCTNAGQACASVERIYAHESILPEFRKALTEQLRALRQGPPSNTHDIDVGPITMAKQAGIYKEQIADAKAKGLDFLVGGNLSSDGRYLHPTLIEAAAAGTTKAQTEESFGPIAVLQVFKSRQELIALVNQSNYGLLASIFSKNLDEANRLALEFDVGTVTINDVLYTHGLIETPWSGRKDSGFGVSHSEESFKEFVRIKHIHAPLHPIFSRPALWWYPYSSEKFALFRALVPLFSQKLRWRYLTWKQLFRAGLVYFIKALRRK